MALALTASVGTVAPVVDQPQTVQAASKTVKSGSLTFHIKKKQVRKSSLKGKKILVLWVDVTNHGKKTVKSDMLMNYSGVNAYQKVHGKWQELTTGATNSSSLIKGLGKMEHNLKPHKTIKNGVIMFTLENRSKVKVEFQKGYNQITARRYFKVK
ncbi:DUF5067 domain-containing protein [Lactobacillus helveticus]|nr:DUF5067 domain-containing protein [Lactobacillus helveticus]ADX70272.1 Putative uncharacterized protein [Lactobacillus helveticus H10]KXN77173.1 hypothetical protein AY470_03655 [Lactobacillus helveticus]MCT3425312.1 DUF5067 domain-containing protein [Lactobacillus helveticus]NRN79791.1 hypothetical protein [Lactobacillus helveticus]NRN84011.1 hypothetical protein [Lactobacillus helveticus]